VALSARSDPGQMGERFEGVDEDGQREAEEERDEGLREPAGAVAIVAPFRGEVQPPEAGERGAEGSEEGGRLGTPRWRRRRTSREACRMERAAASSP
jgi:hypothetical protein